MKLIAGASVGLAVVTWLIVVAAVAPISQVAWPIRLLLLTVLLVFFGTTEWLLWMVLKPPTVSVDAMEVSSGPWIEPKRMQRSDLALIFRGQVIGKGRTRGVWYKSYVFAKADGTVGMSCNAQLYTPDAMAQFAQRLKVPIKGDFSVQVKDRVDASTA